MDLEGFMKVCDQFRLGELITEKPHPGTIGLAELSQREPYEAVSVFHQADLAAMETLMDRLGPLPELVDAIKRTAARDGRIFLVGCGATGRLSLSIETFAREAWLADEDRDRVISFMAGGDAALIRSIEAFEDYPEYGARQLMELGYTADDLLLAITEGGETSFVIGACMKAAEIASESPWFLFCNPPEILSRTVERSRLVLESGRVNNLCLEVGPMALSGSTRLQATTVQMLVAGAAISEALGHEKAVELIERFQQLLEAHNPAFLVPFIEAEATVYRDGHHVLYQTDHYGITVLTDTTERAPTFSLAAFENRYRPGDEPACVIFVCPTLTTVPPHGGKSYTGNPVPWSGRNYVAKHPWITFLGTTFPPAPLNGGPPASRGRNIYPSWSTDRAHR